MARSPKPAYLSLPLPPPAPTTPPSLRQELTRPFIYLPLLLSSLLFLLSLWDQHRYSLSLLSPVLFLWSTILLPLPTWAHVLWLLLRGAWGWYDSYRELVRITLYEGVTFFLLLPFLEDVRLAVRSVIPLLPLRIERKGLEARIVWGWMLAQCVRGLQGALGRVAGVSRVSGEAYRKALEPYKEGEADREGFLVARLNSLLRSTSSLSTSLNPLTSAPPAHSPEDGPAPSPVKRKPGRPRRSTANPYSLAAPPAFPQQHQPQHEMESQQSYPSPPASKASTAGRRYRLPASPPPSDGDQDCLPPSGSATALEHPYPHPLAHTYPELAVESGPVGKTTPERRYPRRTKMSVDMRGTPELGVPHLREKAEGREVKLEEQEEIVTPVKRGRGRPKKNV